MRLLILLGLLVPSVACDQATKALAVAHLKGQGPIHVVDGLFKLVYAENPGAFLGLGRSLPDGARSALLIVGVAALLAAISVVVVRTKLAPALFWGLPLVVAGGAGNLVDRMVRPGGRVVDFAVLGIGPVHTGVFNVADVYIVAGALLIALGARSTRRATVDG